VKYHTRVRLRAVYHGFKLILAGIVGNDKNIEKYISIHGNPDDFHLMHYGDKYYGEVIYLIQEAGKGYGFFAEFKTLLENLMFAEKYGFIPCVRYGKKYAYYDEDKKECDNPFEYYFEPIGKEIDYQNAVNVLVSKPEYGQSFEFVGNRNADGYHFSDVMVDNLVDVLKKYVRIKPEIIEGFDMQYNELTNNQKVLGVHYRGTDFKVGYDKHPKQVELQQICDMIESALGKYGFSKVFIATDDNSALDLFIEKYGSKVVFCRDVKRSSGCESVAFSSSDRREHHYKLGLEVLRDAYYLSRCDGLICGISQVAFGARLIKISMNEKYSYLSVIDNGLNNNMHSFSVKKRC